MNTKNTIEITPGMNLGVQSPEEAIMEEKITESKLRSIIRECLTNLFENVDEKAKSKAQQRFMGMVHAVQKGELDADEVGSSVAKAAKTMKKKDVKDFAETKHKGLPNHVTESELVKMIKESVQEELVDVLSKYTRGEATAEEANKAIMNLANSSNMKMNEERESLNFPEYAAKYYEKNGKKLPDEVLRNGNKKWGERFHNNTPDGKCCYVHIDKK